MDVQAFWKDVIQKIKDITPNHPDGLVYLVSRHNREKNTTAGMICTAVVEHAAECLVNNTHDVATPEQIKGYHERQEQARRQILRNEVSKKQQYVMVVDREEAAAKGIQIPEAAEPASKVRSGAGVGKA